jgi:hypothetical protein
MKKHENLKVGQYDRFLGFIFGLLKMGLVQKNNTKYYQYSMFTFLFFIYKFYDINLVGKIGYPA